MRAVVSPFRRRLAQTTAAAALLAVAPVSAQVAPGALPMGEDRPGLVTRNGSDMTVTLPLAARSVINWDSYDIGTAASVQYTNLAGVDLRPVTVLNRVIGTPAGFDPRTGAPTNPRTITSSSILGRLSSDDNISVFLVNQAGILFGQDATVSVGSLVASTRDIDPGTFLRGLTNDHRFAGTSDVPDPAVLILDGDRTIRAGSTDPLKFAATGVVALIAGRIETRGTINAGAEVAIVAADDATLTLNPGSPLAVRISAGTSIATPMVLRGTLSGGSVIVAATRRGLTDGLLDIDSNLVATSATASDGGIKLVAGYTDTPPAGIAIDQTDGEGAPAPNFGLVPVALGNTLTASGVAGGIELRAKDGIGLQPGAAGATLLADQGVLIRADAGGVALGAVTGRLLSATANGVDIGAAAGAISLGPVVAQAAAGGGAAASIVAAGGPVSVASLLSERNATLSGSTVTIAGGAQSLAGSLSVTATNGSVTANSLRSAGLLTVTANAGTVGVGSLVSDANPVRVRAAALRGTTTGTLADIAAGQDADVAVGGTAAVGTVDADTMRLSAGGALSANLLTGRTADPDAVGVYASGGTLTVGTATASAASVQLIAEAGDGIVTSLNAGRDGSLYAAGRAALRGGGIVGRDLFVGGASVVLGGVAGTQQAGGNAYYNAREGAITAASTTSGLVIRGDAGGTGSGAIVLDAQGAIDLGGVALVTGDPAGTTNTGNVGIRLGAGAPLTLGSVDANALRGVVGEGFTFVPLATAGAVTLGDTRLLQGLALSTPGTISLGVLAISGGGETLSVTGTGAASTITASGTLSAAGGITVRAPGAVSLADVTADAGAATLGSTGATLRAGTVRGDSIAARAQRGLELASAVADVGGLALTSVAAGITVSGAVQAPGDVSVDAPGAIATGAVTSTAGSVLFRSSGAAAFGTIEAAAVSAGTDVIADRATGIRLASADALGGAVSLRSTGGIVRVDGSTGARTSVTLAGTGLILGAVSAGTTATLTAATGSIVATGAIGANGTVTLSAPGIIDVRDVTSEGGAVVFGPGVGTLNALAVRAASDLDVSRAAGIRLTSATSTGGRVSLRSSDGAVSVGGDTIAATGVLVNGRTVTLGAVTARNGGIDLSAGAGALGTGRLSATGAIIAVASGNAAIGGALAGAEVSVTAGGDLRFDDLLSAGTFVRAGATGSLLAQGVIAGSGFASLTARDGSVGAGNVDAGGYVLASAGTGVSLARATSTNGRVELLAGSGRADVAGAVTARDFVRVLAETGIGIGSVTDTGSVPSRILARSGAVAVTGATSVGGPLSVEGATGVTLGAVTSTGGGVGLTSSGGAIGVGGPLRAQGAVSVSARDAIGLGDVTSGSAGVTIASANGAVSAAAIDAATDVGVIGQGAVTLARVDARTGAAQVESRTLGVGIAAVTTRTALSVKAAAEAVIATATVGTAATLTAREVRVGTLRAAELSATANGSDLLLTSGEVAGAATLTKTGPDGSIAIDFLKAGSARITSASAVRADRLEGGTTTISAVGDVAGRSGGLVADVASLTIGTGSSASLAQIATVGDLSVAATGAAVLAGQVRAGGSISVSGGSVTLGSNGPVAQSAGGSLLVASKAGPITGLAGLTLRSDAAGAGGRDLTLRSAEGMGFAEGTLIAGGPDRQSAVRLAAGAGRTITLQAVEARTIASLGVATTLVHEGAVSIARVGSRDTLSLRTSGAANPLAIGAVEVRAGDLRLEASGALSVGLVAADGGTTTLVGASVSSGSVATRVLDASAIGDLRLAGATTTGAITLASATGDITGSAVAGGYAPLSLASSGGTVTVRAAALDGVGGTVLLDSVAGAGGIDVSGRTITVASLVSSAGGVRADTQRDAAAVRDARLRIGSIDAAGSIALSTGNRSIASDGGVTLDRATSAGGAITITTLNGGLGDRSGAPATVLSAPAGPIAVTLGGPATIGAAIARSVAVTATQIDVGTAAASGGALTLAAGTGPLTLGAGSASGSAVLTSGGDIVADRLTAAGGGTASAARDATVGTLTTGGSAVLTAGRALVAGNINAGSLSATGGNGDVRIATAMVAGGAIVRSGGGATIGTLDAGAVDLRAGGAASADVLNARAGIVATAAAITVGQASARGGDVALTATGGDIRLGSAGASGGVTLASSGAASVGGAVGAGGSYRIDAAAITLGSAGAATRQSGAEVALVARSGSVTAQGGTTLAATRSLAVTANGQGGAIGFVPETTIASTTGDVALAARGAAALGSVSAANGAIRIDAADLILTRGVSAQSVALTNVATAGVTRLGDTGVGNETEFGANATRFDLNTAEAGLIAAPIVSIASGARDVVVGALALSPATGSTRFAITANGRIDMLGRFVAAGSTASRLIAIGGEANGARTATIRVAATPGEGGRLLVEGATLRLDADRIGVGLDRDFLDAIDYRGAGLGVNQVTREYVARPTSTLYNASGLGAQPYSDTVLIRSGTLSLTYGRYALIQNTGRPGEQMGVVIGTAGVNPAGPTLRLATPGSASNTFALFGTIDGINSSAAALLGPDRVQLGTEVSPVSSRINGCVIGSGAGCLNTSIAQPTLNLFDTSRAEIVRTADDLTLPFDPLIGTNNEALYLDPAADQVPPDCEGETPCPTKP